MPSGIGIQGVQENHFECATNLNRDNDVSLMSVSVWAFEGVNDVSFEDTLERTDKAISKLDLVKVKTADDVRKAKAAGKMAITYNAQGADFVIADLNKVKWARERGISVMNFTYNNDNALAGGGQNPDNNGISELGKQFIKRMNEEKLIIDVSHSRNGTVTR